MGKTVNSRSKILKFEKALRERFVSRDSEIHACLLALLSQTSIILLGPGGIAKSLLVSTLAQGIGGASCFVDSCFETTMPDAILGPINPALMPKGEFQRNMQGYAPSADIVFLDEIFHANGAVIHAMYGILNEREIRNGSELVRVPCMALFFAANHIPNSAPTQFLDRIVIRKFMRRLSKKEDVMNVIASQDKPSVFYGDVRRSDFECAYFEISSMPIGQEAREAAADIFLELNGIGVDTSERRMKMGMRVAAAEAWLAGEVRVGLERLVVLRDVLVSGKDTDRYVTDILFTRINKDLEIISRALTAAKEDARASGTDKHDIEVLRRHVKNGESTLKRITSEHARFYAQAMLEELRDILRQAETATRKEKI